MGWTRQAQSMQQGTAKSWESVEAGGEGERWRRMAAATRVRAAGAGDGESIRDQVICEMSRGQ